MQHGFFISFEGGEGVGKTTQIENLKEYLSSAGHDVIITREPGGTPEAEKIRDLVSDPDHGEKWTPHAELMLFFAARAMHIKDIIQPAIESGQIVLCDRYIDSTRVYQGHLQNLDMNFILQLEKEIVGTFIPNLTFIMDLDAETAMTRVQERGAKDHYDRGDLEFYEALRQGFLKIAADNAERCVIIDASQDKESIAAMIADAVDKKLG